MDAGRATADWKLEGRLGNPELLLHEDPRVKPELVAALAELGLDGLADPPGVDFDSPEDVAAFPERAHHGFEAVYTDFSDPAPSAHDDVTCTSEHIETDDGHRVELRIYRSGATESPAPCVVYIHGGGMTILDAFNKVHQRWCTELAATGMVAVGVDFRNAWSPSGRNPFPVGLNDCSAAIAWIHANRERLGIGKIVLEGESGGANLAISTTLKAKREGHLESIDGVYAIVPYISGAYGWDEARKLRELPSLLANDDYFVSCEGMALLVRAYDPTGENTENPLCWPYFATKADLEGLPPHVVVVNELDPLRDEGIAYFRKLLAAGVPAVGRVNLGLVHAAEGIFLRAVEQDHLAAVQDIKRFATSL